MLKSEALPSNYRPMMWTILKRAGNPKASMTTCKSTQMSTGNLKPLPQSTGTTMPHSKRLTGQPLITLSYQEKNSKETSAKSKNNGAIVTHAVVRTVRCRQQCSTQARFRDRPLVLLPTRWSVGLPCQVRLRPRRYKERAPLKYLQSLISDTPELEAIRLVLAGALDLRSRRIQDDRHRHSNLLRGRILWRYRWNITSSAREPTLQARMLYRTFENQQN